MLKTLQRMRHDHQGFGRPIGISRMTTEGLWVSSIIALLFSAPALSQVQDIYRINSGRSTAQVGYHYVELAPGKELVLGDLVGAGKVTYFYYTDEGAYDDNIYPGLVLKVYWDGASEPSIQVPLWNFFGAFGHKTVDYQSLPMQINHYCYMSYLPMPFSKRARLVLLNDGKETYSRVVAWGLNYEMNPTFENETSRLHAAWYRSNPVKKGVHPILEVTGRGAYIGNFLQVKMNTDGWWAQGSTIFSIDGETVTQSTGTEDEYGSTWGFDHTFSYPYSGYIQMDGANHRMYRWYLANPVRFQKSLRVVITNMVANQEVIKRTPQAFDEAMRSLVPRHDDYTSVAFWYQEGAHPAPALPSYAERVEDNATARAQRTR